MARLPFSAPVSALLERRGATRAPASSPAELTASLERFGLAAHPAVLDFERSFGGLAWLAEGEPAWIVGTGACLASGWYAVERDEQRGLVPIAYGVDDAICSLDPEGRAFVSSLESARPKLCAPDGRSCIARLVLWDAVATLPETHRRTLRGARGEAIAAASGAEPIADASADDERWWSLGAELLVVERRGSTTVASSDPKRLEALVAPAAPRVRAPKKRASTSAVAVGTVTSPAELRSSRTQDAPDVVLGSFAPKKTPQKLLAAWSAATFLGELGHGARVERVEVHGRVIVGLDGGAALELAVAAMGKGSAVGVWMWGVPSAERDEWRNKLRSIFIDTLWR